VGLVERNAHYSCTPHRCTHWFSTQARCQTRNIPGVVNAAPADPADTTGHVGAAAAMSDAPALPQTTAQMPSSAPPQRTLQPHPQPQYYYPPPPPFYAPQASAPPPPYFAHPAAYYPYPPPLYAPLPLQQTPAQYASPYTPPSQHHVHHHAHAPPHRAPAPRRRFNSSASSMSASVSSPRRARGGSAAAAAVAAAAQPSAAAAAAEARAERARQLEACAADAVRQGDDIMLGLLVASWAGSLHEADSAVQAHSADAVAFQAVFCASDALWIVASHVLFGKKQEETLRKSDPDEAGEGNTELPGVQKALVALFRHVLYGDGKMHAALVQLSTRPCLPAVQSVYRNFVAYLRSLADDVRALDYTSDDEPPTIAHVDGAGAACADDPLLRKDGAITPGDDTLMRPWRMAVTRLHAELAAVSMLRAARSSLPDVLVCALARLPKAQTDPAHVANDISSVSKSFENLSMNVDGHMFISGAYNLVSARLSADISDRSAVLSAKTWPALAQDIAETICTTVAHRAAYRIGKLESQSAKIDDQLMSMGLGFGPAVHVAPAKHASLLVVGDLVERLVEEHLRAMAAAEAATAQLDTLLTCVRSIGVASVSASVVPPSKALQAFYESITSAFAALDDIRSWSCAPLHSKVMGCFSKSLVPKLRTLRFEEPMKTVSGIGVAACAGQDGSRNVSKSSGGIGETDNLNSSYRVIDGVRVSDSEAAPGATDAGGSTSGAAVASSPAGRVPGAGPGSGGKRLHKPRHARMKSSPDELLHLHSRLDDSDSEAEDVVGTMEAIGDIRQIHTRPMLAGPAVSSSSIMMSTQLPSISHGDTIERTTASGATTGLPPSVIEECSGDDNIRREAPFNAETKCGPVPNGNVEGNGHILFGPQLDAAPVIHVESDADTNSSDGDDGMMIVHDEDSCAMSMPRTALVSPSPAKLDGDQLMVTGARPPAFGSAVTLPALSSTPALSSRDEICDAKSTAAISPSVSDVVLSREEQIIFDEAETEKERRKSEGDDDKKLNVGDRKMKEKGKDEAAPGSPASKGSPSGSGSRAGGSPGPSHMRSMSVDDAYTF
jgi:hypothetical protein